MKIILLIHLLIQAQEHEMNRVDGLFVEEDAMLIKKIPLSRNVAEDTLYWPYSTSGNYKCKSGYKFLKEEEELQLNAQTPPICHKHVWKEVWQMQAPPKIKKISLESMPECTSNKTCTDAKENFRRPYT